MGLGGTSLRTQPSVMESQRPRHGPDEVISQKPESIPLHPTSVLFSRTILGGGFRLVAALRASFLRLLCLYNLNIKEDLGSPRVNRSGPFRAVRLAPPVRYETDTVAHTRLVLEESLWIFRFWTSAIINACPEPVRRRAAESPHSISAHAAGHRECSFTRLQLRHLH